MDVRESLPEVFETDVFSVEDYRKRIKIVNEFFEAEKKKSGHMEWKTFYRGDRYCAKTQSNLFRRDELRCEADNFARWKKENTELCSQYPDEFMQLAYMQHEESNTRLLDFTTDELVALRFACGKAGERCRRKVTLYCTDYLQIDSLNRSEVIASYMRLVKGEPKTPYDKKQWEKDVFVEMGKEFPRIERQKGLFLLMGNFTTSELLGHKQNHDDGKGGYEKVKHELSPTIGRGKAYKGYVGVLNIDADCVESIRDELESMNGYQIDYLMDEKKRS
jgi:hypothetical protein